MRSLFVIVFCVCFTNAIALFEHTSFYNKRTLCLVVKNINNDRAQLETKGK